MKRLLLLEDDLALGHGIQLALQTDCLAVTVCRTLAEARDRLAQTEYQLLILDVNLPEGSGLDLLAQVRKEGRTPVILLTANDMETDVVAGLESGADDYMTKPFSLAILRARVNAQLRRSDIGKTPVFEQGPFHFDFYCLEFFKDQQKIFLSRTEQKLLRLLVEHHGQTMTRESLVDRIWTDGAAYVDENALSVTVKRLRDKLEDVPSKPRYLKTVYGVGYIWEGA